MSDVVDEAERAPAAAGLLAPQGKDTSGFAGVIQRVAREAKVPPFRQLREIAVLQSRSRSLRPQDYYDFQVYRPELSMAEKREFLGDLGSSKLNLRMAPPMLTHLRGFLGDKLAFTALMAQLGLPTTQLQAAFSPDRYLGNIPTLAGAADIVDFLEKRARYPLFGKPMQGLRALGSVRIDGQEDGDLLLGSGHRISSEALAEEIVTGHRVGYLFQDVLEQHEAVSERIGSAIGCVRIVTVIRDETPEVLYAAWKIPAPRSVSDNFWQPGSMIALLDVATGVAGPARRGLGPASEWLDTHPLSGLAIKCFAVPNWAELSQLARNAHAVFPINGVLGWDIAIGPAGGIIVECNENPSHTLYQDASGRGFLNAEIRPILDQVIARNVRLRADMKARHSYYAQSV